jgi:hypothetical protein
MRRWPRDVSSNLAIQPGNLNPAADLTADARGDRVRPFAVSGGQALYFPPGTFEGASVVVQEAGAQLLCSHYVGQGLVGFVKIIKACPYKPSILHNSQYTEAVPLDAAFIAPGRPGPDSDNGWWSTPMGWEAYFQVPPINSFFPPRWEWRLQLIPGQLSEIRTAQNMPAFSFLDPNSWALIPNLTVPLSTYQSGFPGSGPPGDWGAQRMQWFGMESGEVHVVIPEDTTVALFATWTQGLYSPGYQATDGAGFSGLANNPLNNDAREIYVLGPSFGQLIGYEQPNIRDAARRNAVYGWQS